MHTYFEFFCGGGMVRAALEPLGWRCLFANDIDEKKASSYSTNWGNRELRVCDVAALAARDLPKHVDMAWASFPCQDLSLAGAGAGIRGERSGTFWPFWKIIKELAIKGRAPRLVVLENVVGALTSHDGKDFAAIGAALTGAGYRFGAVVVNASNFVPQSRPRLFVIAVNDTISLPDNLIVSEPNHEWHSRSLVDAYSKLSIRSKGSWVWWQLPSPTGRDTIFADLIEENPANIEWHSMEETKQLLAMMSSVNRAKVSAAKKAGRKVVGAIYKRTRLNGPNGEKVQRAEIRFDDVAGCLRTPAGGSSRQTIMIVDGKRVRSRLVSPRETARLMGLLDTYILPKNNNDAYHLTGDGVVVPVVRFLAENIFGPALSSKPSRTKTAA